MNNWPVKKLGEVVNILNGYAFKSSDYISDGVKLLRMSNITREGTLNFNNKNTKYLDSQFLTNYKKFILEEDDLVVAMTDMSKELGIIGKVTRVTNKGDILLNQRVGKFEITNKDIDQGYLYFALLDEKFKRFVEALCAGGLQYNVSASQVLKYQIAIPPFSIQKKIVERLDAIRKAQELCNQQIQKTEELFESLLIQIETISGSKVKISDICFVKGGKRIPKGLTFSSKTTNRPYLRVADFKDNSIDIKDLKFIDDLVFEKISNYIISKEDVYISIAGTTGLIGLIPDSLDSASLTENAAKLVIKDKKVISKEYLMYCLLIPSNQSSFRTSTHSTSVGKLALFRIQNTIINLPLLKDQQEIVEKLEAVQNYKKLLQKEKTLLKELFDSVLDKSMKGELDINVQ